MSLTWKDHQNTPNLLTFVNLPSERSHFLCAFSTWECFVVKQKNKVSHLHAVSSGLETFEAGVAKQLYWACPWLRGGWGDRRLMTCDLEVPAHSCHLNVFNHLWFSSPVDPQTDTRSTEKTLCQICSQQVDSDTVYSLTPLWIPRHLPNPAETVNGPLPWVKHLPLEQNSIYKVCKSSLYGVTCHLPAKDSTLPAPPTSVRAHREPLLAILWFSYRDGLWVF